MKFIRRFKIIHVSDRKNTNLTREGQVKIKTLFMNCGTGAVSDMLTIDLLELLPDPDTFLGELNAFSVYEFLCKGTSWNEASRCLKHLMVSCGEK